MTMLSAGLALFGIPSRIGSQKGSKGQRVKGSKSQKVKGFKRSKGQRVKGSKGQRVKGSKGQRVKGSPSPLYATGGVARFKKNLKFISYPIGLVSG